MVEVGEGAGRLWGAGHVSGWGERGCVWEGRERGKGREGVSGRERECGRDYVLVVVMSIRLSMSRGQGQWAGMGSSGWWGGEG